MLSTSLRESDAARAALREKAGTPLSSLAHVHRHHERYEVALTFPPLIILLFHPADRQSTAVAAAASGVADGALARVTAAVDDAYDDEQAVEAATRRVHALLQGHAHQTQLYARSIDAVCDALKELGDAGSWAAAVAAQAAEAAAEAQGLAAIRRARRSAAAGETQSFRTS